MFRATFVMLVLWAILIALLVHICSKPSKVDPNGNAIYRIYS